MSQVDGPEGTKRLALDVKSVCRRVAEPQPAAQPAEEQGAVDLDGPGD